jgi:hypothetical protein
MLAQISECVEARGRVSWGGGGCATRPTSGSQQVCIACGSQLQRV